MTNGQKLYCMQFYNLIKFLQRSRDVERTEKLMAQVTKEHYIFSEYVNPERWMTYYHQISEITKSGCKKVLYCGIGDGIVVDCVRRGGVEVDTFDFSPDLNPDIVGDVTRFEEFIPVGKYDCIVCCQLLEHIPFNKFESIVKQFWRCCNGVVILSLPDRSMKLRWLLQIPLLIKHRKLVCIPRFWEKEIEFKGEHYWESGNRGYRKRMILMLLAKYFTIIKSYNVYESPEHWFVILRNDHIKIRTD